MFLSNTSMRIKLLNKNTKRLQTKEIDRLLKKEEAL